MWLIIPVTATNVGTTAITQYQHFLLPLAIMQGPTATHTSQLSDSALYGRTANHREIRKSSRHAVIGWAGESSVMGGGFPIHHYLIALWLHHQGQ
jgi:hypothetical protein